jgi:hypothetical protein
MNPLSQQIARSALHAASEQIRRGELAEARKIVANVVNFLDKVERDQRLRELLAGRAAS